jgi:urease accessory protein UreE
MGKDVDACCDACRQFGDPERVVETVALPDLRAHHERVRIRVTGRTQFDVVPTGPEVSIGRVQGNTVVLPSGEISRRQCRIVFKDGHAIVVDMNSACGTYVDGLKIHAPTVLRDGSVIYAGDWQLRVVRSDD